MKIEELYQKVINDESLKKAFLEAKEDGKLAEFLAENGCGVALEEAKAFLASKQGKDGELSDDELDRVAGGRKCGTIYNNCRPVVAATNDCEYWVCEKCGTKESKPTWRETVCSTCGSTVCCGYCKYSRYEDALLQCFNPQRYNN